MMESTPGSSKGFFGLFGLAATIYIIGIGCFAGWLYLHEQHNLIARLDTSLLHATHAAEQILGTEFIETSVTTDTPLTAAHAHSVHQLSAYADECGFGMIGSTACKNGKQQELIIESRDLSGDPEAFAGFQMLAGEHLPLVITDLTYRGDGHAVTQTIHLESLGDVRLVVRYTAIGEDSGYATFAARNMEEIKRQLNTLMIRSVGTGLFLYIMAFPLILLYNIVQRRTARETAAFQELLQQDYALLKERETELEDAIQDLERFNTVALGRESRIIELKAEVNTLLEQMKQQKRYNIDHVE